MTEGDPMKATFAGALAIAAAVVAFTIVGAQEKKVTMADLPPAVQQAIKTRAEGGTIRGLSTEVDEGKRVYEASLTLRGRNSDLTVDEQGNVIEFEEETTLDKVPAAARDAIQKAAGTGKITLVEAVTENGKTMK